MDLELSFQATSLSYTDELKELHQTSQSSESLCGAVDNPEASNSSAIPPGIAEWTRRDDESQAACFETASPDTTDKNTNEELKTLTDGLDNERAKIIENVSENDHSTLGMLHSADTGLDFLTSHTPQESLSGEHSHLSDAGFISEVCTAENIYVEENRFPSLSPIVVPSDGSVGMCDDCDIPSSSPPVSSPLTFRGSSPMPTASSQCEYVLTPPTSPIKVSNASTEFANIPADKVTELSFNQVGIESDPWTVISDHEPTKSKLMSIEDCLPEMSENGTIFHEKVYQRLIPGPKRGTLAAQKMQHQRLSKPFRPLTVQQPVENVKREIILQNPMSCHKNEAKKPALHTSSFTQKMLEKMKNRSARAAAQFKSPLSSSSTDDQTGPLVRPTPTIQALERKLQLLKRAVKVKEDSEEEVLRGLIQKWTEAGREIAWEVWGLVKENVDSAGNKRQIEDSWGWQDAGDSKRQKTEERLWGWDVVPVYEREAENEVGEGPRRTLGTMLMDMGIAPETFGWNRDEERFED